MRIFLLLILTVCSNLSFSQMIYQPSINRQDKSSFTIDIIESRDNNTIVNCTYTSSGEYANGGWVMINPNIIIKETSGERKYKLIKSEGMPLSPNKHTFNFSGEKLRFKLYFPKIDSNIKNIDIIESENNQDFFNFYGISLKKDKLKNEGPQDLSYEYIKFLPIELKKTFTTIDFVEPKNVSLVSYFNGLIEKSGKEKFKDIEEITVEENETAVGYTFVLNNKVNPVIEFFFRFDSNLKGGIDFTRFAFTNKTDALLFFNGFIDYYGYMIKIWNGVKMFSTELNLYFSQIRFIKHADEYYLVEISVSDKSPFEIEVK